MTPRDTSPRLTPQVVVGLFAVLFGLALTAANLGFGSADRIWDLWPLILVAIGVSKLTQAGSQSSQVVGGFLIVLGGIFLAERVLGVDVDFRIVFSLAIVVVGGVILYRAWQHEQRPRQGVPRMPPGFPTVESMLDPAPAVPRDIQTGLGPGPRGLTDSTVSEFAFWSGVQRRVASPAFRHGDLTAVMGGIEIDLRPSTINGEAVIDVFCMWGGIEITVPPDWAVSNQVVAIMGGAEDSSSGTQDSRSRLILRGFVLMGGVEIKTS